MESSDMVISDDILESAHLTEADARLELALSLFSQDRITLGQAARLADLPQLDFQGRLANRGIPIHYDVAELDDDFRTLQKLDSR